MAKDETRRWRGWRTSTGPAPIKGSQPTKRPGTRRTKKGKLSRWFWVRGKKAQDCPGCGSAIAAGAVIGFSSPDKVLCSECVDRRGLKIATSKKLAEERRAKIIAGLKKASDG